MSSSALETAETVSFDPRRLSRDGRKLLRNDSPAIGENVGKDVDRLPPASA